MSAKRSFILVAVWAGAAVGLAGCGEKPQTSSAAYKKAGRQAYEGSESATQTATGWKPGDRASWESQMRTRNQWQNEYKRTQ